ncbi:hypothetical protein MMC18_008741 [Xylographa bjoerkii]|nr:hypothetical protein [Xylographa bjoerkii]
MSAINVPVPCPREGLAAFYDTHSQTLTVSAKGEAPNWMIAVRIQQQVIMGGLKFALLSNAGGVGPAGKKPFDVQHKLNIALPNPVVIGKNIIFVTADSPHGFVIPINYGGYGPPAEVAAEEGTVAPTLGSVLPPITIVVPGEGKEFKIHAAADTGSLGSVNVEFDAKALKLVNAAAQGLDIVWTFEALALGQTLVNVTSEYTSLQTFSQFAKIQGYAVDVVVLEESSAKEVTT